MPTTGHGLVYPDSTGNVNLWEHFQNLADSVEAALDTYETFNSWTPTWVTGGFSALGSGGISEGFYCQEGKRVHAEFRIQLGTSPTVTAGTLQMNLPVAAYVWGGTGLLATVGSYSIRDTSATSHYSGSIGTFSSASTSVGFGGGWNGTSPAVRASNTIPITWAVDDVLSGVLDYRAA